MESSEMNKRCPFCGSDECTVQEGDTFRWRHMECTNCGAVGPEVRCQTIGHGTPDEWEQAAVAAATDAWNNRV